MKSNITNKPRTKSVENLLNNKISDKNKNNEENKKIV